VIPSYNSGMMLAETVRKALEQWRPVWVVVDGSTDGSDLGLEKLEHPASEFRLLRLRPNGGKGAAVLAAFAEANKAGFTRALVMDSDGQHPAESIRQFMAVSVANPDAMVLGVPRFGPEAPASRRRGRLVGNWWTNLETMWGGVHDSLFGFRVYPIQETLQIFQGRTSGRRYDFDTVAVVRLFWLGIRPLNIAVPVRYFTADQGGVSHFRYWRDNVLLVCRHTRLAVEMLFRWPAIWRHRQHALAQGTDWVGQPEPASPARARS
jgi:glycosyltransferase involved in cell wall biosynthesis